MKYYYIAILGVALLGVFYVVEKKSDVSELVAMCQHRDTSECPISQFSYTNSTIPVDGRIKDLLSRMTLQEKIGQMMLIERNSLKNDTDIALYGLGGLLSGMGSKPDINTPEGWLSMVNEYTRISKTTRLGNCFPTFYWIGCYWRF